MALVNLLDGIEKIYSLMKHIIINNTKWALINKVMQIAMQTLIFVLLVKLLSTQEFGIYSTVIAINLLVIHFVNPGITNIVTMQTARNHSNMNEIFSVALFTTWIYTLIFTLLISSIFLYFYSAKYLIVFIFITVTEIGVNRYLDIYYSYLMGQEEIKKISFLQTIYITFKLIIILIFFLFEFSSNVLVSIVFTNLIFSILFLYVIVKLVNIKLTTLNFNLLKKNFKLGIHFAIGITSKNISTNADKIMLSKMISYDATAIYTLANRVVQLAVLPLQALMMSTYASFFKYGENGISENVNFLKKISFYPLVFSIILGILIWNMAFLVTYIFGEIYNESIIIIKAFAFVPVLLTFNNLIADALTGAGFQYLRSLAQILTAIINIMMNFILILHIGILGAAIATLFSEVVLAFTLLGIIIYKNNLEKST